MRVPLHLTLAIVALAVAGCVSSAPPTASHATAVTHGDTGLSALRAGLTGPAGSPVYYLALGDSLSRGIQPTAGGGNEATAQGYPDQLATTLRSRMPGLRLVKLGCSGETTSTMIHGGMCRYPAGSQLAQAVRFLRAHLGRVALITIDIGANDPNSCILGARPLTMLSCLSGRVSRTEANLDAILATLRATAGPRVLIVGMTYYVPELGLWHRGRTGREIAVVTDDFAAGVNRLLAIRYHKFAARVADVFGAFRSADFGGARGEPFSPELTPPNVAAICALTWMCAAPPRGPNEHANASGYHRIAQAFWRAIIS